MPDSVHVPERVKDRLDREHDERGIPRSSIVVEWMEKADKFDAIQADFIESMQTRGGGDE